VPSCPETIEIMSLTGNLEDLPLLDIIQIVSFSKKTGYLTIGTARGEAAIVFREGFVVSSFSWDSLPIDPRVETLPEDKKASLIRNRIEMALEQLIRLREGQFGFHLTDDIPRLVGSRDIALETLTVGINPQELLLDLARGIDEDRRDSSAALEASFADPGAADLVAPPDTPPEGMIVSPVRVAQAAVAPPPTVPDQAPATPLPTVTPPPARVPVAPLSTVAPPAVLRTILLVDDEEDVRRALARHFRDGGYEVLEAEDPDSCLKTAGRLGREAKDFILVTDLGMPTSGGSSFQGGFEIVKRLWKMSLQPPVLMMTERLDGAIQARARQMEISSIVFKPGISKLDPPQFEADLKAFASKLLEDVLPALDQPSQRAKRSRSEKKPPGPSSRPAPESSSQELSLEFSALQRRLDELRNPEDANQISMTVIKVAREFFERGILFLVKSEQLRGLGGFGAGPADENLNLLVREIVIPLNEPSVFLDAVMQKKSFVGPIPEGKWARHLVGRIGRFRSEGLALFPLVAHRETIALLFGDNPETGREFSPMEAFEVFLNQAGVALENAFLQRKLESLQQKG
jgi:CheY-like chemotaxis protein